ncbi:leucine-rich repeat domain-containing protein [Candidatus Babeliales bacterium]|nr:leucine-rich repeat domain-containing protein [Candidatus Babeliales bacterium]
MVISFDSSKRVKAFFFFFFFLQVCGTKRVHPVGDFEGSEMKRERSVEIEEVFGEMQLRSPEYRVAEIVDSMGLTDDIERKKGIAKYLFNSGEINLRNLGITDETLVKIMPKIAEINAIKSIKKLNLSNNELETLPNEIGLLSNLEIFNLEKNKLVSLPDTIGNLTKLNFLWLNNNDQLKWLPETIINLVNLVKLWLPDNLEQAVILPFSLKFELDSNHPEMCEFEYPEGWQKSQDITIILGGNVKGEDISDPFLKVLYVYLQGNDTPFLVSSYKLYNAYKDKKGLIERVILKSKSFLIYEFKECGLYLFFPKGSELENYLNLSGKTESLGVQIQEVDTKNIDWIKNIKVVEHKQKQDSRGWVRGIKSFFSLKTVEKFWWNVLLYGHGNMQNITSGLGAIYFFSSIAQLEVNDFQDFITFFDEKKSSNPIFTLIYETCYGGGYHLVKPYLEEIYFKEQKYPAYVGIKPNNFVVVSALTRSAPGKGYIDVEKIKDVFATLELILNYKHIYGYESLRKKLGKDPWEVLLGKVAQTMENRRFVQTKDYDMIDSERYFEIDRKKKIKLRSLTSQTPLIKFPGISFFTSITRDNRILRLTNVLLQQHKIKLVRDEMGKSKTIEEERPILIPSTTKAVFLYPNLIDVPVKFKVSRDVKIVSLNPGPSMHYFSKSIDASLISSSDFISFFRSGAKEAAKAFAIKEVHCRDGVLKNVLIYDGDYLYRKNGRNYRNDKQLKSQQEFKDAIFMKIKTWKEKSDFYIGTERFVSGIEGAKMFMSLEPVLPWQTDAHKLLRRVLKELLED